LPKTLIREIGLYFFSEQSNLDDSNSTVPEPIDPLYDKLAQLHITETDRRCSTIPSSLLTRFHQFLLPDDSAIILSDIVEK
jgi:hypothetical protein